MRLLNETLAMALEDIADGKKYIEREYVFYARITDLTQLNKAASAEFQEQWEIRVPKTSGNAGAGQLRTRMSAPYDINNKSILKAQVSYSFTAKLRTEDKDAREEATLETTEEMFKMFNILSTNGMRKVRFNFPVAGTELVYEVDMFISDETGEFHEWCKIDLEVKEVGVKPPPFPVTFEQVIPGGAALTPENDVIVRGLFDNMFLTKKRN